MKPKARPGDKIKVIINPKTGISPNKNIAVQYAKSEKIHIKGCFLNILKP
jgi:hypothetical protein